MEIPVHIPVLADAVVECLRPVAGGRILDATLGGGGHFRRILRELSPRLAIGMDRDLEALARAAMLLRDEPGERIFLHGDFRDARALLGRLGLLPLDGILVDLGFSSLQLDTPRRGFSFAHDGPLDMRMDRLAGERAADLIRGLPEEALRDLLRAHGEEPRAARIARALVAARERAPIDTTARLVAVVHAAVGPRAGRIDSATRTFQALRIAVNGERDAVDGLPEAALAMLRPGGRCCIISFHSLEDRPVKRFIRAAARDCVCDGRMPACICGGGKASLRDLLPRPAVATAAELAANPRARSAKLRAFEKS